MVNLRKELAPIVVFGYNRPQHLQQTLTALNNNDLSSHSQLYIFLDAAKYREDEPKCRQVYQVSTNFKWKGWNKKIISRTSNFGLAKNITDGVSEILDNHSSVIVLEDDIVTSKGFLRYMNDALKYYRDNSQVMHIAGYMHPIHLSGKQQTYFYQVSSCWGWATWASAWKHFNNDHTELYELLKQRKKLHWFDLDGSGVFLSQLKRNLDGTLKSWAIKWQASVNLRNGFSLHPYKSLVRNIGFDSSGANCKKNEKYSDQEVTDYIQINEIPLELDTKLRNKMKKYYRKRTSIAQKGVEKLKHIFSSAVTNRVKWNKVAAGPGKGSFLFVNKQSFGGWNDMLTGSFDNFWYSRLDQTGLRFESIIDVGAHFGYHTLCLQRKYPDAQIIAVEPNPFNLKRLRLHLEKNDLSHIIIESVAVSSEKGELEFSYSDNVESSQSTGSYLSQVTPPLSPDHYTTFKNIKVHSDTLDEICHRNSFKPDLIKIDVEGAEILALRGGERVFNDIRPYICLEAHSLRLEKEACELLESNYKTEILAREEQRSFIFCSPK